MSRSKSKKIIKQALIIKVGHRYFSGYNPVFIVKNGKSIPEPTGQYRLNFVDSIEDAKWFRTAEQAESFFDEISEDYNPTGIKISIVTVDIEWYSIILII